MTDQLDDGRAAAYSDLVAAIVGARRDPATERFDRELAAAEAAGSLDAATARTLRWWQRETVRAVEDHLAAVLPLVLARIDDAESDAVATVAASADSWVAASGATTAAPRHRDDRPDGPGGVLHEPPPIPPGPGPAGGAAVGDPAAPHLRPVDRATSGPQDVAPPLLRPGFAPGTPPAMRSAGVTVAQDSVTGGAPPRRLLVAGLTVLTDDDLPSERPHTARIDPPGTPG